MTKPKLQPKTPSQLADEHWAFVEGILLESMRMEMKLYKEAFIHGCSHGNGKGVIKQGEREKITIHLPNTIHLPERK